MRRLAIAIFCLLVLLALALKERESCPNPDDTWVLSDRAWVCVRATPSIR